jgi:hypothetical protein
VVICLLLAAAQVALGGYQMGVGNQAIQIAFLKKAADPLLYSSDAMVWQTMPAYPSYFFRMLALLLGKGGGVRLETLYLSLQLATSFASLAAVYALGRSIYRSHAAGLAAAVLLVGGHLTALAGDGLYSMGFTHTYAALPVAVAALALGYRGKWVAAFVVAGLLFNIHALTASYVMVMLGAGLLADVREMKWKEWGVRAALCGGAALFLASPTLGLMLRNSQVFDGEWVKLMRIRSAEHSFPSTWWVAGDTDVPRYVLMLALFVMSWSFGAVRRGAGGGAGGGGGGGGRGPRGGSGADHGADDGGGVGAVCGGVCVDGDLAGAAGDSVAAVSGIAVVVGADGGACGAWGGDGDPGGDWWEGGR